MESKNIIPIFYEHSSLKSILVPWNPSETTEGGPVSIFTLAQEAKLNHVHIVSNHFYNFVEMQKTGDKLGIPIRFGIEMWVTDNIENSEQSTANESKVIIWMKNPAAYKDLIKLYSAVYTNPAHKYYHYRGSWGILKKYWTENLSLTLPFFDSFIHRNLLNYNSSIIPDLPCNPIIQREIDSDIPFAGLINFALDEYNKNGEYEEIKTKTIMYNTYEDVKPYIVYRAIGTRGNYGAPNLDYMCSNKFCFENWKEIVK